MQKLGPGHAQTPGHLRQIDAVVGKLLDYFETHGVSVVMLSEYGIEPVHDAVRINRFFRKQRVLRVREEEGLELLDPGRQRGVRGC